MENMELNEMVEATVETNEAVTELANTVPETITAVTPEKGINGLAIGGGVIGGILLGVGGGLLWKKVIGPALKKHKDKKAKGKTEKVKGRKAGKHEPKEQKEEPEELDMDTVDKDLEIDGEEE